MGTVQQSLFPYLDECLTSPLTEREKHLVKILELIQIEKFVLVTASRQWLGRPIKEREAMGHSSKKMIDEIYGNYRQGLVDEREQILDYLGEDFLALEELRIYFPERYREKMSMTSTTPKTR